jgi:TPR repeat protein
MAHCRSRATRSRDPRTGKMTRLLRDLLKEPVLIWLLVIGPLWGCNQRQQQPAPGQPAPSSSVMTIVAGLGYCEDRKACEAECDGGSSARCRRLGVNYEFGHGVDVDGAHATELYEKSCAMTNPEGCVAAGRMHEFHHGVPKDDEKAARFYERACDMTDPTGCANFGIMLENGRGTTKDLVRAKDYFNRACSRGAGLACVHLKALEAPDGHAG